VPDIEFGESAPHVADISRAKVHNAYDCRPVILCGQRDTPHALFLMKGKDTRGL
jgi:hypothetical protein